MKRHAALALLWLLAGCSLLPDWMGAEEEEPPLPGERIAILAPERDMVADSSLTQAVMLPAATPRPDWPQIGSNAANQPGRIAWTAQLSGREDAEVGRGKDWETRLIAQPVAAEGKVFAMDGAGWVSAHEAGNIDRVLWTVSISDNDDRDNMLGGGLAYGEGKLFAVSGFGEVTALDAATGKQLWKRPLGVPLRAAPKLAEAKLFVISKDNQLFALAPQDGRVLWKAAGLGEIAGYVGAASPAIDEGIIVAPYSSGEVYGLTTASGRQLWQESLGGARRIGGSAMLYDISANPVIEGGMLYVVSSSGSLSALELRTGERRWEQKIASIQTPAVAGDYLFVLSLRNTLACVQKHDGRIRWVAQLPSFANPEKQKDPLIWSGPVVAGEYLLLTGAHGKLLLVSPQTGSVMREVDIPDHVTTPPVVAGETLYMVTRTSRLVAVK